MSEHRARLAARLAQLSGSDEPDPLSRSVFGVGGGEAVDLAIKLARAHTGRPGVISARGGYHGHTGLALAAGDPQYREPFGPMPPGFGQVPFGDLAALEAAMDDQTAAVIFETLPATLGMPLPPDDYFAGVRALCDAQGAVMISDEVQTGLGRCGEIWGIDRYGVRPDVLVTAKGLSGGLYPIAATLYRESLNAFLHANPFIHVSTFGGAEIGCYVALEVLDILTEPGFLEHVRSLSEVFGQGFNWLQDRHPGVLIETRRRGLMMGLKLAHPGLGPFMTVAGFQNGLLAIYANNDPSVLQLLPPLIIDEDGASQVLDSLDRMLSWVSR
jgi:acetylornithine/succinyldiaminopimelate/putrescine aminotransferase